MSDRNTGLFLTGHVPAAEIGALLWGAAGVDPEELRGEEAVRVGHGTRNGLPYTHVGLRLFEVGGVLIIDQAELPGAGDLERVFGEALSRRAGQAVFLFYDEVNGAGGHARFEAGALVSRLVYDGRGAAPVRRTLSGEERLDGLDPSDWVWVPGADAVEAAATLVVGPGVRDDDDIARLIEAAAATPVEPPARATPTNAGAPKSAAPQNATGAAPGGTGSRLGLRRLFRKLRGR